MDSSGGTSDPARRLMAFGEPSPESSEPNASQGHDCRPAGVTDDL